jgi:hypothetical protein
MRRATADLWLSASTDSEMAPQPLKSLKTDSGPIGPLTVAGKINRSGDFRIPRKRAEPQKVAQKRT